MSHEASTTTRRRHRRTPALVMMIVALAVAMATPPRATSAQSFPSDCPEITDSIERLYRGYLQRSPDANEFHIWVGRYQRSEVTLVDISASLQQSDAYRRLHGTPSVRQFVINAYRSTTNASPSPADADRWTDLIEGGYPRAQMMLSMTETRQFTEATDTVPPLAGYGQWYPAGTHWYCGTGSEARLSVIALTSPFHVDLLFTNNLDAAEGAQTFALQIPSRPPVTLAQGILAGPSFDFRWDQRVEPQRSLGGFISISAQPEMSWAVVFHPTSIGSRRQGWEINP